MHKSIIFYLAVAGVIASVLLVLKLREAPPIPPPLLEPARNPYPQSVAASGIVEAMSENISIGVPVAGLVANVKVQVWDRVEKNQSLFQLDDRELRAELLVQEANIKVAVATLERLKDQLTRLKSVNDPRAVSIEDVRTRENDVVVADAQLESAKSLTEQTKT